MNRDIKTFPLKSSSEFGNNPRLIGSKGRTQPVPERASGRLLVGDQFFLMTDALAQWFLRDQERGGRPWDAAKLLLSAARPEEAFAAWIKELREYGGLRNDDVTLLAVEVNPRDRELGTAS